MASASGGQDQAVRFCVKLKVSKKHDTYSNLTVIQTVLMKKIKDFQFFLTEEKKLPFLHLQNVFISRVDNALYAEFEFNSEEEIQEFKKVSKSGTLVSAIRKYSNEIQLYRLVQPMDGLKFTLDINDASYKELKHLGKQLHHQTASLEAMPEKETVTVKVDDGSHIQDKKDMSNNENPTESISELNTDGAQQMESVPTPQNQVDFYLKLRVSSPYNFSSSLKQIQKRLQERITDFCQYLNEDQKLSFLHLSEFKFVEEKPSAVYIKFTVYSKEEIEEFNKASKGAKLSSSFTAFAYLIKLNEELSSYGTLKLYLNLPLDLYKEILALFIESDENSLRMKQEHQEHVGGKDIRLDREHNDAVSSMMVTSSDASNLKDEYVEKKFMVYIPNPSQYFITKVLMKWMNKTWPDNELFHISHGIYGNTLRLPLPCINDEVLYKYEAHISYFERLKDVKILKFVSTSECQRVRLKEVQQDFWNEYDTESFKAHLKYTIFNSYGYREEIKSKVMEMEGLLENNTINQNNCILIIQGITSELKSHHKTEIVLCIVAIGNLLENHDESILKCLDQNMSKRMILELQNFRLADLPVSCEKYMPATCLALSKIAIGHDYSLLVAMFQCCPFLNAIHLNVWIESTTTVIAYETDADIKVAQALTAYAKNEIRGELNDDTYIQSIRRLMQLLVTRCPLWLAHMICKCLQDCRTKDEEALFTNTFEIVFYQTCTEVQKGEDISLLLDLWTIASENDSCLSTNVEDFEIQFVECLKKSKLVTEDNVEKIAFTTGLFNSNKSQTTLVELLGTSSNLPLYASFLKVLRHPKFEGCRHEVSRSTLTSWFYVLARTHLLNESYTLKVLYKHIFEILEIMPESAKGAVVDVLDSLTVTYLKQMDIMKFLQGLHHISQAFPPECMRMCARHVNSILHYNRRKLRPQQVLETLMDNRGKVAISSRLAAEVVCFVLDTYCSLSNEDTELERLKKMTNEHEVWVMVYLAYGQCKHHVINCSTYGTGMSVVSNTLKLLTNRNISYQFFDKGSITDHDVRSLLYLSDHSKSEIDELLFTNNNQLKNKRTNITVIRNVINVICDRMDRDVLPETFGAYAEQINILYTNFDEILQSEFDSKFADLFQNQDICRDCKLSSALVMSQVYWNCYKSKGATSKVVNIDDAKNIDQDFLEGLSRLFEEVSIESPPDNAQCTRFVCRLLETANKIYTDDWKMIQDNPMIDMRGVFTMYRGCFQNIEKEIEWAENHLRHHVLESCKKTLIHLSTIKKIKGDVDAMEKALTAFHLNIKDNAIFDKAISSFHLLLDENSISLTFKEISEHLDVVFSIAKDMDETTTDVLESVGKSSSLVDFLAKIIEEDIRNLIDAVEDISEQHVSESTVSSLIEVKRFFKPILLFTHEQDSIQFLQTIQKQVKIFGNISKQLPTKIDDCMNHLHNLISLYNNVANRGEQTKQIIHSIVTQGKFHFLLVADKKMCEFTASYRQAKTGQNVVHPTSSLCDFRSRALLLMNSERQGHEKSMAELEEFVNAINVCLDVSQDICALHLSGHLKYPHFKKTVYLNKLHTFQKSLEAELKSWNEHLKLTRKTFYLMNFIQGTRIHALGMFLQKKIGHREVDQILKFIHPEMNANMLERSFNESDTDFSCEYEDLMNIGKALTDCFKILKPFKRVLKTMDDKERRMTDMVENGKLLVVRIDEANILVVKTVLALYLRTSYRLPEPSEILLCSRETSWSDIELLLGRCFGANQFFRNDVLFCIANVEVLPNEINFRLIETLKNLDKSSNFLLSVICQGSANQPFIDEFYEYVTTIRPLSDETVRNIFSEVCPSVKTFTSDSAGLGKSSTILTAANKCKRLLKTVHVSGPVQKRKLINRLRKLDLQKKDYLHIDIGYVDNPLELDLFLFELIILNYVIADGVAMDLPTTHVCIEIANTINNTLRNALQTAVSFKKEHKVWKHFEDFIVSKDINSPVQVVCQYLYLLEKGTLDRHDTVFSGVNCVEALPTKICRYLLKEHINLGETFITTNICINVLADQLKKMSNSGFFKTSRIRDMTGSKCVPTIKSSMVKALLDVSREFASRSVETYRNAQQLTLDADVLQNQTESMKKDIESVTGHVEHMIRWDDSNHLIYIFHNQNIQTISPMYRQIALVPDRIKELFESQMKRPLCDFQCLSQRELQDVLQKVARTNPISLKHRVLQNLSKEYALTPDNLLKMVLIILRIKACVPVLVMGETGCGKTSLIRYLAEICEVSFDVISIHAGVEESVIIERISDNNEKSLRQLDQEHWVFLDEINTSEYIGLISDMLCHHKCLGKTLAPNLILLAACNPYKLRSSKSILTSGLKGKVKTDELSRLVYRVLPLPESLIDYVWDFGSLTENDEKLYIERMVVDVFHTEEEITNLFVDLLSMSQMFSRTNEETASSVSLRDIQRCKILTEWFLHILEKKKYKFKSTYQADTSDKKVPAIILALSHCYISRFSDTNLRRQYILNIAALCAKHGHDKYTIVFIQKIIMEEQRDILSRMDLPPGTAMNIALQENVFVLLVCILNRIPIFLVGKPGCSKSLSMQVIKSNLRGKDSKDEFFRTLPQLYCVSFQGSESSTSDGIVKVFEKAEKYQQVNSKEDVLSVVILDEIGLAEISRFNPLKVLHNLLEPGGQRRPNIAVVGISNWSLDASKMNRAIHLSRPEMDVDELIETGKSISVSFERDENENIINLVNNEQYSFKTCDIAGELENIARSYTDYMKALRFENFHGLRDYYSLVKYIARELSFAKIKPSTDRIREVLLSGVQRNFGGLPFERKALIETFNLNVINVSPVLKLVMENVTDPLARHLMIITAGESVLGVIERSLKEAGRDKREILFGSQFEEDLTDDYNYRMLSRIILCMEQGIVLILKGLKSIYGSLYDMLNKNYTEIGRKKHCRVALGAYSNPICHVHDNFRCIVLIDETEVDFTDPPFLNRFEKQRVRFSDIISSRQQSIINEVEQWISDIVRIQGRCFSAFDCFPIYGNDMVASYVLQNDNIIDQYIGKIREDLLWVMKPEVVTRMKCSSEESTRNQAEFLEEKFFNLPLHDGITGFLKYQLDGVERKNLLTIVFTNSNIHSRSLYAIMDRSMQIEKLGAYKSEKQLSSRIQNFWLESDKEILFVQCSAIDDERHILLAKSVIERNRNEFLLSKSDQSKHVYLVVHMDKSKGRSTVVSQINFLSEWQLVMLDRLESSATTLPGFCRLSLYEAVMAKRPMDEYIKEQLFWTFTRIKYTRKGRNVDSINTILKNMKCNDRFIHVVEEHVCLWVSTLHSDERNSNWVENVACDTNALDTSLTFVDALEKHINREINKPLSKFIYQMEVMGILDSYFVEDDRCVERRKAWEKMLSDGTIFSISGIHDELGPETYECQLEDISLKMPFSLYIFNCIESTREEFMNSITTLKGLCDLDEDDNLPSEVVAKLLLKQKLMVQQKIPNTENFVYSNWIDDYIDDFCHLASIHLCSNIDRLERVNVMKWMIKQKINLDLKTPDEIFTALHTTYWNNTNLFEAQLQLFEICQSGLLPVGERGWVESILHELRIVEIEMTDIEGDVSTKTMDKAQLGDGLEIIYSRVIEREKIKIEENLVRFETEVLTSSEDNSKTVVLDEDVPFTKSDLTPPRKSLPEFEENFTLYTAEWEKDRSDQVIELIKCSEVSVQSSTESTEERNPKIPYNKPEDGMSSTPGKEVGVCGDLELISGANCLSDKKDFAASYKLVQVLCTKMLPSISTVVLYGGLQSWQMKVNVFLRFAANVSNEPSSLHKLRFCNEISSEIVLPVTDRSTQLAKLADVLKHGTSLDSKIVFESFLDILNEPKYQRENVCQRMLSNYLMRCISLDPETKAMTFLFEAVLHNRVPDSTLSYMKLPLATVLHSESKEMWKWLLKENVDKIEIHSSCLVSFEKCATALYEQNRATPLASLAVSIIEEIFDGLFRNSEETESYSVFLDGQKGLVKSFSLSFLASVSCCKAFISFSLLKDDALSEKRLQDLVPLLFSHGEKIESSLTWYFMKCLGLKVPFAKLWLQFKDLREIFPDFQKLEWCDESVELCTEMSPLRVHAPERIKYLINILNEIKEPSPLAEKMEVWFAENKNDFMGMISFYGAVIQHFYLPNLYKPTDDTKGLQACVILDLAEKCRLTCENIRFLKRLLGKQDFDVTDLLVHQGSSSTDFFLSSVLTSLYSMLITSVSTTPNKDMSIFAKCLLHPHDVKNSYLPGVPGNSIRATSFDCLTAAISKPILFTCVCGIRIYMREMKHMCSNCGTVFDYSEDVCELPSESYSCNTGFVESLYRLDIKIRKLSPVLYNILSFLTNGCLLGSVALGNAVSSTLENIGVPENASDYLWNDLENHWQSILQLLNVDEYHLSVIFQAILYNIRTLICENMSLMLTETERNAWEDKFVLVVENVISNRFHFAQAIFENSLPRNLKTTEGHVREYNVTEIATEQKVTHKLLFRICGKPRMENFLYELEKQKGFPFLHLVLDTYQDLSMPKHILSIVQWHICVVSNISYIMKRDNCLNMTVTDFLHQTSDKDERTRRRKRFEAFKRSWREVNDRLTEVTSVDCRFHGESKLSECLILDEKSVIFKVLEQLIHIQNNFLDKALTMAHVCKATRFLCRTPGESMIPCIQLTEVTAKQLVDFSISWEECLSDDSQSHFLHGQLIVYDFYSIEKFLAVYLLNGKAHINLDRLPMVVFADEMYRNFASLVTELRVSIEQSAISKHITESIHANQEKNPQMVTELLTHLGVIMALLKKTKGDPDMPLIDYAEKWAKLLTLPLPSSLLPSPPNCIKLCHVVALHELLEELNATSIVEALEEDFRQVLDSDIESHISYLVEKKMKIAELALGSLKRFVFRCLSVRDANPKTPLKRYISDESFWPANIFKDGQIHYGSDTIAVKAVIPDGLMVSHIYWTIACMDEEIEKKRTSNVNITQIISSFKPRAVNQSNDKMIQKKKANKLRNY